MKKKIAFVALLSFFVLVLAGCSKGKPEDQNKNQEQNQMREQKGGESNSQNGKKSPVMPAEVLSACQDKNEGDSCSAVMSSKDGSEEKEMAGTCKKFPGNEELACMPENAGPEQGGPANRGKGPESEMK